MKLSDHKTDMFLRRIEHTVEWIKSFLIISCFYIFFLDCFILFPSTFYATPSNLELPVDLRLIRFFDSTAIESPLFNVTGKHSSSFDCFPMAGLFSLPSSPLPSVEFECSSQLGFCHAAVLQINSQ